MRVLPVPDVQQQRYRPEIDGLRALAVAAVVINHLDARALPSGYLGVDIFFVISGYVITASLAQRPVQGWRDFVGQFYGRRLRRLLPALLVFVLVSGVLICLFNPDPADALRTGLAALLGVSNLYLLSQATDYFAPDVALNPYTHTWSLGVEEQFYLLYPLLVWVSGLALRKQGARWRLAVVLLALSALSLAAFVGLYGQDQAAAYFLMPTRFWELSAGGLVWLLCRQPLALPPGLALIGVVLVMLLPQGQAVLATALVVAFTMLLLVALRPDTWAYRGLSWRPVVQVGLISYSLYLWHWGVLSVSRWLTLPVAGWWIVPQLLLMLALAWASYRWVEQPFRHRQGPVFGPSLAGVAASGLVLLGLEQGGNAGLLLQSSNQQVRSSWWQDSQGRYIETCHAELAFSPQLLQRCLPAGEPGRRVWLLGDSHARNYLGAVRGAFPQRTVRYLTMGHGCAYVPPPLVTPEVERKVRCGAYGEGVRQFLQQQARPGDLVVVGQGLFTADNPRISPLYWSHLEGLARLLQPQNVPLVVLDGTVPMPQHPALCTREWWRPFPNPALCSRPRQEVVQRYARFEELARASMTRWPNLAYVRLRDGLCQGAVCGQISRWGTPIWHDKGHITNEASAELAPLLKRRLAQAGMTP